MLELDIEYTDFLCKTALTINNYLSNSYRDYLITNKTVDNYPRVVDYEHNEFLFNLIKSAEEWVDIEAAIKNDMLVLNYKRLSDLIRYMHGIDYLNKTIHKKMEESIAIPQLSDFLLNDSDFRSLSINSKQQTCNITLSNVLVYNDSRLNYSTDVDTKTILIKFLDVSNLDVDGSIYTETLGLNRIYKWYTSIVDNKVYNFKLLAITNYKKFLFSVQCSNVKVTIM